MSGHGESWWWRAAAAEQEPSRLVDPDRMTPEQRASVRDRVELTPAESAYFRSFAGEPVQESRDERADRIIGACHCMRYQDCDVCRDGQDFDRLGR